MTDVCRTQWDMCECGARGVTVRYSNVVTVVSVTLALDTTSTTLVCHN